MGCATLQGAGADGAIFNAVVCGGRGIKPCIACGRLANRQCDFKMRTRRSGLCDAHICARCTTKLPGDKDACPQHAPICIEACRRAGIQLELGVA